MLSQHKRYWAEISLDAAENNFRVIKERIKPETKLCCVVKADAYGHGAVCLARLYEKLGADYFAVSNIEEALQLRKNNIKHPIMILGYTPFECAKLLADNDIEQSVYSYDYAEKLNEFAETAGVKVKIHLKLDSGMSRIGFCCKHGEKDNLELDMAAKACGLEHLIPHGVFTHFAVADEGNDGREYTLNQFKQFSYAIEYLQQKHRITFQIRHCANSGAIFDYPEVQLDMVRAGIVLYGCAPSGKVDCQGLRSVMSLKAVVSMVKKLVPGDCVSYGCTYRADSEIILATIPVGYADGFWRSNFNKATFIIKGKKVQLAGRVCMDQLMIDVSSIPDVMAGDEVIIMGEENGEKISASDIGDLNHTINYEILCAVGKRVPRYYIKNGETIDVKSDIISCS
ncbi:MAG: alanine racemase [Clostridia bacterium]|nr:alanine racemase [Clostridia bacterium]